MWPLLACLLVVFPSVSIGETASESAVKAAYIYNFLRFIDWPAESFSSPDVPFQLCIAGDRQLAQSLSQVSGQHYGDRELIVTRLDGPEESGGCQLLYFDADNNDFTDWFAQHTGEAILTLSSKSNFIDQGGMIGFVRRGDNLHFEVNHNALLRAGLTPRATLLEVAKRVTDVSGAAQ